MIFVVGGDQEVGIFCLACYVLLRIREVGILGQDILHGRRRCVGVLLSSGL